MRSPLHVDVKHGSVRANGVRLHYVEKGRGPVILLLHGFPESWWSWRCQIEPFARAGYRVIAPDLRGYAGSDAQGPYDIGTLTQDVRELLAALEVREAHVVGHDWGGALAWCFAGRYPEVTRRLAILNAPHPGPLQRALRGGDLRQLLSSAYMFFFLLPGLPEWWLTRNDASAIAGVYRQHVNPTHFSDEELRPFRDAIQRPGAAKATLEYYRAALTRALLDGQAFQGLARVSTPTLVVWGMRDPWLRFDSLVPPLREWAPELEVLRIADAGHFVHCEQPERVNAALLRHIAEGTTSAIAESASQAAS